MVWDEIGIPTATLGNPSITKPGLNLCLDDW